MYCKHCGNQLPDGALYCPSCGASNKDDYFDEPVKDVYSYSTNDAQSTSDGDTGRFAWAVLGFFVPIAGLILYFVLRRNKPRTAKKALIGAIVGFAVEVTVSIIYAIIAVVLGFAGFEYSSYLDMIGRIIDIFTL